jgi:hypothetical protein
MTSHGWYRREVRVVRTGIGARSWKSAQGFRKGDQKLRVKPAGARMFHYGWVRPPRHMTRKAFAFSMLHAGPEAAARQWPDLQRPFDYGKLRGRTRFRGTHPAVMRARIAAMDWKIQPGTRLQRHDRLRIRLLSFLENHLLGFRLGEHRNYVLLPESDSEPLSRPSMRSPEPGSSVAGVGDRRA